MKITVQMRGHRDKLRQEARGQMQSALHIWGLRICGFSPLWMENIYKKI
jgi:hypothetical protein